MLRRMPVNGYAAARVICRPCAAVTILFPQRVAAQGNEQFKARAFERAIKYYTVSLKLEPEPRLRVAPLNNRALSYIKLARMLARLRAVASLTARAPAGTARARNG